VIAIGALTLVALALTGVILYMLRSGAEERRRLTAALLQKDGATDAARRVAAPTPREQRKLVEDQLKMRKEAMSTAPEFSAANPFARSKPHGV